DSLVYTADKTKKDLAGKITQEQISKVDAAVAALKDALASNDMTQVKAKSEELQKVLQEIGTVIYQQAAAEQAKQQQQQQQEGQAGPSGQAGPEPQYSQGPEGEKVVDSEDYKVK
ncbi:MAG TPA: Hsp70 family protein, partial [Candidatus Bathyarchaeia archaeon]|nr:Hsp70 family protein [Candidatus Bathyarchaeia archaeon]